MEGLGQNGLGSSFYSRYIYIRLKGSFFFEGTLNKSYITIVKERIIVICVIITKSLRYIYPSMERLTSVIIQFTVNVPYSK